MPNFILEMIAKAGCAVRLMPAKVSSQNGVTKAQGKIPQRAGPEKQRHLPLGACSGERPKTAVAVSGNSGT
jgi:hypothetical protein